MMYNNNFAVAVKNSNKVMREKGDTVYLPFGSEYSVMLKNLNSTNALVNIEIDGEDVLDGNSLIISPNTSTDLLGFMSGNVVTNRFKFIEKTNDIENFRGNRIDDGIIRVEFQFEKPVNKDSISITFGSGSPYRNYEPVYGSSYNSYHYDSKVSCMSDEGITVKGSKTNQDFVYSNIGILEDTKYVIIIKLKGKTSNNKKLVKEALTVKSKIQCTTCGKKSKSTNSFCWNCGTCLD